MEIQLSLRNWPEGAGNGFAGGAGHGGHLLVSQQQRKAEAALIQVLADLMGQFEEEARQAGSHGLGQRDAASVLQGEAVLLADALDGAHLGLLVAAQEAEESFPLDGAELGGGQRLGGDFINAVGENRIQAEHGTGAGYADDHLTVLIAAGGQLQVAAAD